jgi:hypothetical protein
MNKVLMMALFLASVGSVNGAAEMKGTIKKVASKTGAVEINKIKPVLNKSNRKRYWVFESPFFWNYLAKII